MTCACRNCRQVGARAAGRRINADGVQNLPDGGRRCPLLRPDPEQMLRLLEIRDNSQARVTEAEHYGWLGEIAGLQATLASAEQKLDHAPVRRPAHHHSPRHARLPCRHRPHLLPARVPKLGRRCERHPYLYRPTRHTARIARTVHVLQPLNRRKTLTADSLDVN